MKFKEMRRYQGSYRRVWKLGAIGKGLKKWSPKKLGSMKKEVEEASRSSFRKKMLEKTGNNKVSPEGILGNIPDSVYWFYLCFPFFPHAWFSQAILLYFIHLINCLPCLDHFWEQIIKWMNGLFNRQWNEWVVKLKLWLFSKRKRSSKQFSGVELPSILRKNYFSIIGQYLEHRFPEKGMYEG